MSSGARHLFPFIQQHAGGEDKRFLAALGMTMKGVYDAFFSSPFAIRIAFLYAGRSPIRAR
jgi:hypothetical protein